jgi:hypothetical protein
MKSFAGQQCQRSLKPTIGGFHPPKASSSQVRRIKSCCIASRARNSKPWRNPSRYRTSPRSLSGVELAGSVNSSVATSPGSNWPVSVTPMPSCPISIDRPQSSMGASARKILAETRISNGYRGKRRLAFGSGCFVLIRVFVFLIRTGLLTQEPLLNLR